MLFFCRPCSREDLHKLAAVPWLLVQSPSALPGGGGLSLPQHSCAHAIQEHVKQGAALGASNSALVVGTEPFKATRWRGVALPSVPVHMQHRKCVKKGAALGASSSALVVGTEPFSATRWRGVEPSPAFLCISNAGCAWSKAQRQGRPRAGTQARRWSVMTHH